MLLISDSLLASDSCLQYFEYQKIEISQNMTREERREAEIYNLERAFTLGITEYTIADLIQLVRAQKWLRDRGDYYRIQKIDAFRAAAEADLFAWTLQIFSMRNISDKDWAVAMQVITWFKENSDPRHFDQLRSTFLANQNHALQDIENISRKNPSKITSSEVKTLYRLHRAAQRLGLSELFVLINQILSSLNKILLRDVIHNFNLTTRVKSHLKHNSDTHLELEYARQLAEIIKDPIKAGIPKQFREIKIPNSLDSIFRVRQFQFNGTAYRILYIRLTNGLIHVEFLGTHEEYNEFFK